MNTRRTFFKMVLGALGAGIVSLRGRIASAKKLALSLDKVPALKKVGGAVTLKLGGKEILFFRESTKSIRGMAANCTHQNCPVNYNPKKGRIECTCHGSNFDFQGKVLNGPATKPLKTYPTVLSGDKIIVTVD